MEKEIKSLREQLKDLKEDLDLALKVSNKPSHKV